MPSLSTRSAFAILIILIGLLPVGLFMLSQSRVAISKSIDLVVHTDRVLLAAKQVNLDVIQAESGLRGYLLTWEDMRLEFFRRNMAETYESLAELRKLIGDNPNQVRRVNDLKALLDRRFTLMQDAASRVIAGGLPAAVDVLTNEETMVINAAVRRALDAISAEEQALLAERRQASEEAVSGARLVTLTLFLLSSAGIITLLGFYIRANARLSRAEVALALENTLLQATLESCREGILAVSEDGRVLAHNGNFLDHFGCPDLKIDGTSTIDQLRALEGGRIFGFLGDFLPTRQGERTISPRLRDTNMSVGKRSLNVYGSQLSGGGSVIVSFDETTRIQAEAVLRQSQKMDAIGHLTGGIAHDFNNMLQVVGTNLSLLERDIAGNPSALQRLKNAEAGVQRGARLTRQLLAFARRLPLEPRPVDLGRILHDTTVLLRQSLGEQIEIETIVAGGLWNTLVDPGQVENAILNMAINARDAMPQGGKLTIELSNAYLDEAYAAHHMEVKPGQYVMLAISDTGVGIAPELAERVFEPFFTTKPEGQGTGLGLSQVFGFVKQSGGHIKLYSEPGQGTTFKIYLPRTRLADESETYLSRTAPIGGSETVLLVEDDASVRAATVDLLNDLGYSILQAASAEAALAILTSGATIDLLFTDVVMPGPLSSRELARRAADLRPGMAVLFTSGYTANAIVHDGRLDEDVSLISKPHTRDELAAKIRSVLQARTPAVLPDHVGSHVATTTAATDAGGRRVLVVDDDALVRLGTVDMLMQLGYRAEEAPDAEAGLERLAAWPQIDVILVDLGLPGMSGGELIAELKQRHPQVHIIIASGQSRAGRLRGGVAEDDSLLVLEKPFLSRDLKDALDRTLRRDAASSATA